MQTVVQDLLCAFPLLRSDNVNEASARIGQVFSPHSLTLVDAAASLQVLLNQVHLEKIGLNVLSYGAEVIIDPGQRGDFYLLQLPLRGHAHLQCNHESAYVDSSVLSILHPRSHSVMRWSKDCTMLLLQVDRDTVNEFAFAKQHHDRERRAAPDFGLCHARSDVAVCAWWQMTLDLVHNLHYYGQVWMRHPAATAAMEDFILSAFATLLSNQAQESVLDAVRVDSRGEHRALTRAKEYIQAHLHQALRLKQIADYACVSSRTLETLFKRQGLVSPLAYARHVRLQAVHQALQRAAQHGTPLSVTDTALTFGFLHMGRFAAQYQATFGVSPSTTLKGP